MINIIIINLIICNYYNYLQLLFLLLLLFAIIICNNYMINDGGGTMNASSYMVSLFGCLVPLCASGEGTVERDW